MNQSNLPSIVLPSIFETKSFIVPRIEGWDEKTRTQKILLNNENNYNSIIFKPSELKPDKRLPSSLIIAYYDSEDNICFFESLIIPDWFKKKNNNNMKKCIQQ